MDRRFGARRELRSSAPSIFAPKREAFRGAKNSDALPWVDRHIKAGVIDPGYSRDARLQWRCRLTPAASVVDVGWDESAAMESLLAQP